MWEWILKVWGKGGRNIKQNQAKVTNMGHLSGDSRFDMEAPTVNKKVSKICLNVWLYAFVKR